MHHMLRKLTSVEHKALKDLLKDQVVTLSRELHSLSVANPEDHAYINTSLFCSKFAFKCANCVLHWKCLLQHIVEITIVASMCYEGFVSALCRLRESQGAKKGVLNFTSSRSKEKIKYLDFLIKRLQGIVEKSEQEEKWLSWNPLQFNSMHI